MVTFILLAAGLVCLVLAFLWVKSSKWKVRISNLAPLLTCLACIAALTVFLQFYIHSVEETAKFDSRMAALGAEIVNNIQLCNMFNSERNDYIRGDTVPSIRFEYSIAEEMIRTGDITHHKLGSSQRSVQIVQG